MFFQKFKSEGRKEGRRVGGKEGRRVGRKEGERKMGGKESSD